MLAQGAWYGSFGAIQNASGVSPAVLDEKECETERRKRVITKTILKRVT